MDIIEKKLEPEVSRVRMNIWMPKKLFAYIEHIASTQERTFTEVVRDAVREKMQKDIQNGVIADGSNSR